MHKEIYELAKEYLIENIGELVSADDVYFDAQQNTNIYLKKKKRTEKGRIINTKGIY